MQRVTDWNIEDMFEYLMLRQVAGNFAGIRAALLCSVVTNATSVTQAMVTTISL